MLANYARKSELLKQKQTLEEELAKLQAAEEALSKLPLNCQVVEMMHSLHCHLDHTADCGYFYETWDAPKDCKKRLLKQADALIVRVKAHLDDIVETHMSISDEMVMKTIEICQERYW